MASPKIRCGVVGVGSLGQHHARIYAGLPGAELAGIFDRNEVRAAEICARHNCRRFSSIEELGAACEAVSVVVPTDLHAQVAVPLLAKGCHLLIERQICATMEEAEEVMAAAHQNSRLVQVGHVEHFNPVMAFLEKEVSRPREFHHSRAAGALPAAGNRRSASSST